MVEAICIKINRVEYAPWKHNMHHIGEIESYTLQDDAGNKLNTTPEALKDAIKNGRISVKNLTLTSDNRLVTKQISIDRTIDGMTFNQFKELNNKVRRSISNKIKITSMHIEEFPMERKEYMVEYQDIALYEATHCKDSLYCEATPSDIICLVKYEERYIDNISSMEEAFTVPIELD